MKVLVKNQYFDFRNIDNPVQSYVEELYEYSIENDGIFFVDLFVKQNQYETQDDYLNIAGPKTGIFYDTKSHRDSDLDTEGVPQVFAYFNFWISNQEDFYERTVYSFFDFVGQIGGIIELFLIFAAIFISPISGTLFDHEIIRDIHNSNNTERSKQVYIENSLDYPKLKPHQMSVKEEDKEALKNYEQILSEENAKVSIPNKFI